MVMPDTRCIDLSDFQLISLDNCRSTSRNSTLLPVLTHATLSSDEVSGKTLGCVIGSKIPLAEVCSRCSNKIRCEGEDTEVTNTGCLCNTPLLLVTRYLPSPLADIAQTAQPCSPLSFGRFEVVKG